MNIKEKLASLCHDQWSGWMTYLFGRSTQNNDGTVTIPKSLVDRWKRQINTPYALLSKDEKDSDKKEADKFIKLMAKNIIKKTPPDPKVKEVINTFIEYCDNIKGFKPVISWAIEGSIVKKRLGRFTPEQLADLFDFYLNSDDCNKMGCSLKIALGNYIVNKWMINNSQE